MGYVLKNTIWLSDICTQLGLIFKGVDVEVKGVSAFSGCPEGFLSFTKALNEDQKNCILIIPDDLKVEQEWTNTYLASTNPRLTFICILSYLERQVGFDNYCFPAEIHPTAKIGSNVVIEEGCILEEGVEIEHNVVLHRGTKVGKNSLIRTGSSIGGQGFGFERNASGGLIRFPHLGGTVIGENVEIGSLNSVSCGTLSDTVIEDGVKTDNLVHIAHNCIIGKESLITACAELSGGVVVGAHVWIGPNVSIMQKVSIGEEAVIGLGAVIIKDVPPRTVYAGNPAKMIREV